MRALHLYESSPSCTCFPASNASAAAVLAIDLLGFGESSKPTGINYDPHLWKDQVVGFVREIVGEPVVLVGNSIGSQVRSSILPPAFLLIGMLLLQIAKE